MARLLPFIEQNNLFREADDWAHSASNHYLVWGGNNGTNPPANPALGMPLSTVQCPADNRVLVGSFVPGQPGQQETITVAFTSFLGCNGINLNTKDGVMYRDSHVRFADITDGSSTTLLIGERPPSEDLIFGWWFAGWGQNGTGSSDVVLGVNEHNIEYGQCPPGPYQFQPGTLTNNCDQFHFWSLHSGGANFMMCDGSVHFFPYTAANLLPALATRSGGEVSVLP
jgi:prepilin-type processing-associated H-X9-DG protein